MEFSSTVYYYDHSMIINIMYCSYSRVLYDITRDDISNPDERIVRRWIDQLNKTLRCSLQYSQQLASVLINRVVHIKRKVKNAGGRQRDNFLSLSWTFTTPLNSDTPSTSTLAPAEDLANLSKRVKSLESQLQASRRVLREVQQENPLPNIANVQQSTIQKDIRDG